MKKGRFLWSAYRITEKQKAGKAQNIKGKQLQNSRNTVSRQLVVHLSSARDNLWNDNMHTKPQKPWVSGVFLYLKIWNRMISYQKRLSDRNDMVENRVERLRDE